MPYSRITNEMLYVPFTHEYNVSSQIRNALTVNEFFRECFVNPDFAEEIKLIQELVDEKINDPEYLLTKSDAIREYQRCMTDRNSFISWFMDHESAVYCIAGDAGTGKTTYLHYLSYHYTDILWEIVDVQKACSPIVWLGKNIDFCHFELLSQKVISAIIMNIKEILLSKHEDGRIDYTKSKETMMKVVKKYYDYIDDYDPEEEISKLFNSLRAVGGTTIRDERAYCRETGRVIVEWVKESCDEIDVNSRNNIKSITMRFILLYIIVLHCLEKTKKHILVFDNIERFIGTDEIFNNEIVDFAGTLRAFHDSYRDRFLFQNRDKFAEHYQFLISMRNTSARMFTPQQSSDSLAHVMDISGWFGIERIIKKKVEWYEKQGIETADSDDIFMILNDIGCAGETIRGLRTKLDMLFNYNKRLILEFVSGIMSDVQNKLAIEKARMFYRNGFNIGGSISKFAFRMIIWKLILEKLREDELFKYMCISKETDTFFDYGYKILTILSNYSIEHNKKYMSFIELVEILYEGTDCPRNRFFDVNNILERGKIAKVLFYMNYFDRRRDNWLQFIDIQYNLEDARNVKIGTSEDLLEIISGSNANIDLMKIRITHGGKAYLGFIAQTFEFFSTRYFNYQSVLLDIPSLSELNSRSPKDFRIVKHINAVTKAVVEYAKAYKETRECRYARLRKDVQNAGHAFKERVINSQVGYIDNVNECISQIIQHIEDEEVRAKGEMLYEEITRIRERYMYEMDNM